MTAATPTAASPAAPAAANDDLTLAHGLRLEDLYHRDGLVRIDGLFCDALAEADPDLHARLLSGRADPEALAKKDESDLLIELAPHVEDFVAGLFGVGAPLDRLRAEHHNLAPLYACKRLFVQRQAKKVKPDEAAAADADALRADLEAAIGAPFTELGFAAAVMRWREDEAANADILATALLYTAWALATPEGRARHGAGLLFQVPEKTDPEALIELEIDTVDGVQLARGPRAARRRREGFALTDAGTDLAGALDEANYCIHCHNQGKDSCSHGLTDRKTGAYQKSPFGVTLAGCPLDEKISEFHVLKTRGVPVGALAMIAVDNPLCAATGHRICNDCMKSCIYQKQEPVDIPQAETRTLKDVLDLPFGFEIYGLLTRWNPLNLKRPVPRPATGRKVLVVGLGPAGFNLAHHLINDGHTVVGIDGLKIEPLDPAASGVAPDGTRVPFRPVRDRAALTEPLDDRPMAGFGGVAEYGITVRWDKNFLKTVRLLLERRDAFTMVGGVRFGGTLTVEDAFAAGFDHIALAAGAGRPTFIPMPGALARGVRMASDFLMGLQLTGAAKAESVANLEVRLPIVVIGGGLTAIDTATESLAYYPVQVEKFLARYEALAAERGETAARARWTEEETEVAETFLAHARAIRAERAAAAAEGREPDVAGLLDGWGGATVVYRRRLIDAPSYTLNHEEVAKALEEGIRFAELLAPAAIDTDRFGHAEAIRLAEQEIGEDGRLKPSGRTKRLPAQTVLVAAGTQPNTVLAREEPHLLELDGKYFRAIDETGAPVEPEWSAKPAEPRVLMARLADGAAAVDGGDARFVSFWGDLHPSFHGNVVKAMGGAKQGYPVVTDVLAGRQPAAVPGDPAGDIAGWANRELRARVHRVERLTPTIVEVVVEAPAAARAFHPGQFYRLQNFEAFAPRLADTHLAMEGLAMTGAWVDKDRGLVSVIALEMGGSSDLCALLKPGEPVILMGPTGTPTETPAGETVVLVGGGLGNAVLFSIGQALRAAGSRVLYFAGYKKLEDRYKVDQIEAAADQVVWACDEAPGFEPGRPGDRSVTANIVEAMRRYAAGELGPVDVPFDTADRIVAIGSDRMMAAVQAARGGVLADYLKPDHVAIGSINSPMQCMMKEICAQCLQRHVDPETGEEQVVFSCFNQDQSLERVDFACLHERLGQNGLQEKLTAQWIDRSLKRLNLRAAAE
ncbi:MAG: FAD-dependent oxidoreductase [Alphaproteobacteria bacterium]|nr:FAD-dependent oxidoreductase [Alphaproteobacteria bacterium]